VASSTFASRRHRAARFVSTLAAAGALAAALALAGIVPIASVAASTPACHASQLSARITGWEGAAGSRIASVRLYNTSFTTCYVRNFPQVRLVSGTGHTMIAGHSASTTGSTHSIAPLHYLRTEVQDSNYCGGSYATPVTLTFTLTGTLGRVVAIPLSTTDSFGVPPCNGSPGDPGSINMHAWS
jgi:long-subunit fatty acid transport protein